MTGQDLIDFIEATGAQNLEVEVQDANFNLESVEDMAVMDGMIRIYTMTD